MLEFPSLGLVRAAACRRGRAEVGCRPGRLSTLLASRLDLDVTGLDLDPAMIERARAKRQAFGGR